MAKTSATVKNRYNAKTYDRIEIVVPKGQKEVIKAAAEAAGESVNAFITGAIELRMAYPPTIVVGNSGADELSD